MENIDGNTSTAVGVESADSSSAGNAGIISGHPLDVAAENLARARDQLTYGRRQEAEGALRLIEDAQACIVFYRRSIGEGIEGG